jgi:RNase P subunit RPR2
MTEAPELKVVLGSCGARVKITQRRDKMIILHCVTCGTEYGYPEDHPFFTHENALTEVGDYVLFEAFPKR